VVLDQHYAFGQMCGNLPEGWGPAGRLRQDVGPGFCGDPASYKILKRPRPTPLARIKSCFCLASIRECCDRPIEDLLHISEESGLELIAPESGPYVLRYSHGALIGVRCCRLVSCSELGLREAIKCPKAVVRSVGSSRRCSSFAKQDSRLGWLAVGQCYVPEPTLDKGL
jgi:hypothetical protein